MRDSKPEQVPPSRWFDTSIAILAIVLGLALTAMMAVFYLDQGHVKLTPTICGIVLLVLGTIKMVRVFKSKSGSNEGDS